MLKKFKTKSFWESGSGEIVGFMCILPLIISLLVMLISIAQMGSIKEKLEYTTYVAARAAVVSKTYSEAQTAAEITAQQDLLNFSQTFIPGSLKVNLGVITTQNSTNRSASTRSNVITSSRRANRNWKKGNYVKCNLQVKVKTLTPIISGIKTSSLTMMIETPADDLGSILPS